MAQLSQQLKELMEKHPCRYSSRQKEAFILDARRMLRAAGCSEKQLTEQRLGGVFNTRNLIIGNPSAKYLITAHYDTPGRNGWLLGTAPYIGQTGANIVMMLAAIPFLIWEILAVSWAMDAPDRLVSLVPAAVLLPPVVMIGLMLLPMLFACRHNSNDNSSGVLCLLQCALEASQQPGLLDKCCFVLFDNEEWGLIGSLGFAAEDKRKNIERKDSFVINLDCVGVGDVMAMVTTAAPGEQCSALAACLEPMGMDIQKKQSQLVFMSDHAVFPNAVMLSVMRRSKLGPLYIPNIHSHKDTECDNDMVAGLAERLGAFVLEAE